MLLLSAVGKRRKVETVNNCFIGTNSIILKGTIVGEKECAYEPENQCYSAGLYGRKIS